MRKLIHSKFELDLSTFKLTDVQQNSWFADGFFTQYSFPFEIDLVQDLDIATDFISLYNSLPTTFFKCKYVHNDEIQDCEFEITEIGEKLSCTITYGFEQLPSFEKKLSELSLQTFDLPAQTSIYQHANSVISQTWPAVNYNFPAVHTDKYDTSSDIWADFKKTINNRQNGVFLENVYNTIDNDSENVNIMQPLPYWLHILERGFADAGYGFAGDILQDARIKKATLFGNVDYFKNFKTELTDVYELDIDNVEAVDLVPSGTSSWFVNNFYEKVTINRAGAFRIIGYYNINWVPNTVTNFFLKVNGVTVISNIKQGLNSNSDETINFNQIFNFSNNVNTIEVISRQLEEPGRSQMCGFDINPVSAVDNNGNILPSVYNENKIQLKKAVPDITFVDFVKVIKNWFNYDIDIVDKIVYMNRIDGNINHDNAIDMQHQEVKTPRRKFRQGSSFLLKFADVDGSQYVYDKVFQDKTRIATTGYITNDKTNTIEINGLPLPKLNRNDLDSAFCFENNDSKVYLVPYNGLINNKNISIEPADYLLPVVHLAYWEKWFRFRINSVGYFWAIKAFEKQILGLKVKSKIYAFGNTHIIKSIQRQEILPELYNIEIETESL
jgi:hypothetical protein